MSGFSRIKSLLGFDNGQDQERGWGDKANGDPSLAWGNGFMTNWSEDMSTVPDNTGSFGESMSDMGRNLSRGGAGTNERWAGGDSYERNYDSWTSGGLGFGGSTDTLFGTGGVGVGIGGGGGSWNSQSVQGDGSVRNAQGYGGGLGVNGRLDNTLDMFGQEMSMGGEVYRGVGGNAYSFDGGWTNPVTGETQQAEGYGADASYTPLGFNNVSTNYDGSLGSGGMSMENAVVGQMTGSVEGGRAEDGTLFGNASWAPGRTEVHGVDANYSSALGETEAHLGSFGTGPRYQANGQINPETGAFGGGAQWAGGGWRVQDASVSHDFGGGVTADASVGDINTANSWAFNGGYDPSTSTLSGNGLWSTGNSVSDVQAGFNTPYGGANASLGNYSDGMNFQGNMSIGPDGLHAATEGEQHFGGFGIQNAQASYGQEGLYYNEMGVGDFSTTTSFEGGSLDVTGDGVDAHLDTLRTGGFRANNITSHQDILGMETDLSVGHVSNDVLLEGADVHLGREGHVGFDKLDFGGVRVNDVGVHNNLGGLGEFDASMGSFSNGNTFDGAEVAWGEDGVNASLDHMGVAGMDITDVNANLDAGPLHASAGMESLHTGFSMDGFNAQVNGDGLQAHADNAHYDSMLLEGVHASGGIDGLYESNVSLGRGNYNSFNGDNINVGVDGDGIGISGDNVSYSYLGAEDFNAETSYFDGAVGQNMSLDRGSYLGGRADHISYQSNYIDTSMSVDGLNAHGLQLEGVDIGSNIGDANASIGAEELNILDLNVGHAEANTEWFGTSGNASVEDARLDVLSVDDLSAGIGWGDTTVAGASMDYNSHLGVDNASADWDLFSGTANGEFENAQFAQQVSDASVTMFGHEISLPDAGFNMNASGNGEVDLSEGRAEGGVNMSGSSVNFAGYEMEMGDWAQASGGVDVSEGAANWNVGGDEGVGVNASIADANLDINLFGNEIDVDEGISDAADFAVSLGSDAVSLVGDGISAVGDGIDYVASLLPSVSLW